MALGRRKSGGQEDLFVLTTDLPKSVGHVFYQKLDALMREAGFDAWIEELCKPHYSGGVGRSGVPPGITSACCWWVTSKAFNRNAGLLGDAQIACRCGVS